jgi:hypothetical protein
MTLIYLHPLVLYDVPHSDSLMTLPAGFRINCAVMWKLFERGKAFDGALKWL